MDFAQDLKSRVDIVAVIGERVRLRKASANNYQGLCPFHQEKTPSFSVSVKGFYYCFGCQAKGDVIKFIQEIEGLTFYEALKELAERHGIPMPKKSYIADDESRLREAVFQMHEIAAESFRANLHGHAGEAARAYLARRGLKPDTIEQFGLGFSDRSGRALLRLLEQRGFSGAQAEKASLARQRDDGSFYDFFRGRLMFPIHNEMGKIIAFGGRGLTDEDVPKYLNSSDSPVYEKKKILYNLNRARQVIHKVDRAILVEGYMDAIGVTAAGFGNVVAICGTSLTPDQFRSVKRLTSKMVVNLDPDPAGARAAEKHIKVLLEEGFQVRVVELDDGLDPDEYCKERGAQAYAEQVETAKGYFYWLADQTRGKFDMRTMEGKAEVLKHLVPAVQAIPDHLERMQVAIDVAGYIGVDQASQSIVLDAFKKSVASRNERPMQMPASLVRADEKGLLNVLLSDIPGRQPLLGQMRELGVLQRVAARRIFQAILAVDAAGLPLTFDSVRDRLEPDDQNMLSVAVLSGDSEGVEFTLEFATQCLESLRRSDDLDKKREIKVRIKDAERTGNLQEALGLALELQKLERKNGRSS